MHTSQDDIIQLQAESYKTGKARSVSHRLSMLATGTPPGYAVTRALHRSLQAVRECVHAGVCACVCVRARVLVHVWVLTCHEDEPLCVETLHALARD